MDISTIIDSDPERLDGEVCFSGTRVPVRNLFDYLAAGQPLAEFLEDFPRVSAESAAAVIHIADDTVESLARQQSHHVPPQTRVTGRR